MTFQCKKLKINKYGIIKIFYKNQLHSRSLKPFLQSVVNKVPEKVYLQFSIQLIYQLISATKLSVKPLQKMIWKQQLHISKSYVNVESRYFQRSMKQYVTENVQKSVHFSAGSSEAAKHWILRSSTGHYFFLQTSYERYFTFLNKLFTKNTYFEYMKLHIQRFLRRMYGMSHSVGSPCLC